jgi:predicted DNA-binding protein
MARSALSIRVTEEVLGRLQRLSDSQGLTLSEGATDALLSGLATLEAQNYQAANAALINQRLRAKAENVADAVAKLRAGRMPPDEQAALAEAVERWLGKG